MRKSVAAALALMMPYQAWAGAVCERPQDAMAVHTAALQQEMMVAALVCHKVAAYNDFVVSHQTALQESDRTLLRFFQNANAQSGFDDYNFYKTELANNASLRSMHDGEFCAHADANFLAAQGRPLQQALTIVPYPADTGAVRCGLPQEAYAESPPDAAWQHTASTR